MKGYIELYYDLPHLEAYLKASGAKFHRQALKNVIDDFLQEAVLYHMEEKKFIIMGTLTMFLENTEIFEGSRELFRRLPTISRDIFFDTDLSDIYESSNYLVQKEKPSLSYWKKKGRRGVHKIYRTTAEVLYEKEKEKEKQDEITAKKN